MQHRRTTVTSIFQNGIFEIQNVTIWLVIVNRFTYEIVQLLSYGTAQMQVYTREHITWIILKITCTQNAKFLELVLLLKVKVCL